MSRNSVEFSRDPWNIRPIDAPERATASVGRPGEGVATGNVRCVRNEEDVTRSLGAREDEVLGVLTFPPGTSIAGVRPHGEGITTRRDMHGGKMTRRAIRMPSGLGGCGARWVGS